MVVSMTLVLERQPDYVYDAAGRRRHEGSARRGTWALLTLPAAGIPQPAEWLSCV